jgi:hypothetical protein
VPVVDRFKLTWTRGWRCTVRRLLSVSPPALAEGRQSSGDRKEKGMKEPEPTALAFLQANARELREHFDHEVSEAFPMYSMWYEVYALKAVSMAEWDRCVCEACKRYDKDRVKAAVSEIMAHDANYFRCATA